MNKMELLSHIIMIIISVAVGLILVVYVVEAIDFSTAYGCATGPPPIEGIAMIGVTAGFFGVFFGDALVDFIFSLFEGKRGGEVDK